MPWTIESPPDCAKNWTAEEIEKCVAAANAVLEDGKSDEEAIFACIHAAGKSEEAEMSQELSLGRQLEIIRGTFDRQYNPSMVVEEAVLPTAWINDIYDDYLIVSVNGTGYRVPYTMDEEGVVTFAPRDEWTEVEQVWVEMQMGELIPLAELAQVGDVISVQIMRPGIFTEMHGRRVTVTEEDMEDYAGNFKAGKAGQELPIFVGHPSATTRAQEPAAAWYKRIYTRIVEDTKKLWADIELTELGKRILEGKLYKYLSPSVDLEARLIKGGGFVNLPAIKGQPAIELSQFLRKAQDLSDERSEEMTEKELAQLREQIRAEVEAELAERETELTEFAEKIRKEEREKAWAEFQEEQKVKVECADFAAKVCGGEAGLSAPPEEVAGFLAGLDPEQRAAAQKLLETKVVDFSERGHTGVRTDKRKPLPEAMAAALKVFLKGRKDIKDAVALFCEANELALEEYDFSAFIPAD